MYAAPRGERAGFRIRGGADEARGALKLLAAEAAPRQSSSTPDFRCKSPGGRNVSIVCLGWRLGGSAMKLSARNQIKGKVVDVHKGQTTAHVRIDVGHGVVITSSITNEAVDELALTAG